MTVRYSSDQVFEYFGKADPYWCVLTHDRFKAENLSDANRQEFFTTGEEEIAALFRTIRQRIVPDFEPATALDFGCGVGRLLFPLARRCRAVVGIDVSEGMIREARENARRFGLSNVRLLQGSSVLEQLEETFDLVNTYIVLQHIPEKTGQRLFAQLVERVAPGGIGAIHVLYSFAFVGDPTAFWPSVGWPPVSEALSYQPGVRETAGELWRAFARWLAKRGHRTRSLGQGTGPLPPAAPPTANDIPMNPYSLNPLFQILQFAGAKEVLAQFTDHAGNLGVMLIFRKPVARA
ncbi:MAG: class I SAM-dependent methyltransferase [Gemmataceae bacterium]|nr:class I SAM-dependent methyltransferase [Gemmataceae bacterium]MDW8265080.1 class I SAM-dependent methyltransferase [Gemmataceae bacterium]